MKVKELIKRLHLLDPNLEVYITNAEETQHTKIDAVIPCEDFGKNDREEFVAIFPKDNPQPLFTLTPEEVETVVSTFDFAIQKQTEWYTFNEYRLDEVDKATVNRIIERKRDLHNRLKQWQSENQ